MPPTPPPLAVAARVRRVDAAPSWDVALGLVGTSTGLTDLSVLADFALGAALRTRTGGGRRLPTIALTIEMGETPSGPDVSVQARGCLDGTMGWALGAIFCGTTQVGQCSATFAVPAGTADLPALPWESDPPDRPAPTGQERSGEDLVWDSWEVGASTAVLHPTAALLNRSGTVQGGVVYRLAAAVVPSSGWSTGHVQFLRPAAAGAPLAATARTLGETRRTRFVAASVHQGDRLVATGSFVVRRESNDD